jgi:hypothetical protein
MALLDRLRSRPRWQHPDPLVRVDAVRQIAGQDQALLADVARGDSDPRVRRAALRRLTDPRALAELLAAEVDVEVREEGSDALLSWAAGEDEAAAQVALGALSDARRLLQLARSARLAAVRREALARIEDPRLLLTLAKAAEDPAVRSQALSRLSDAAALVEVALKTDHRDAAMAAVDRIDDVPALDQIAQRARHKAASRRARARLESLRPAAHAGPSDTPIPVEATAPAYEEPLESAGSTEDVRTADAATADAAKADEPPTDVLADPPATAAADVGSAERVSPGVEDEATAAPVDSAQDVPATPEEPAIDAVAAQSAEPPARAHEEQVARVQAASERLERLVGRPALALKEADAALRDARALQPETAALPAKLAQRFKAARSALFARAQELREADEWSRWGNAAAQETLCQQLEALQTRDDFERVGRLLREADRRWAEFRQAPKDQAEALRQRYQAARAQLKVRLDAYFEQKAATEAANLEQRQSLCARAEALADSSDWLKTGEELKSLQARWKETGPAPHRQSEALWKRFRAACDRFFTRRNENLQQRKAEWTTNLGLKEALCARAEGLAQSSDWPAAADEMKRIQAEWKGVGPVRKKKSEAVWQRFRAAADAFYERYKNRDALELAAKRSEREGLCSELEAMLAADAGEGEGATGVLAKVQELQARWRQAPRLPAEEERALERRYQEARARLIAARGDAFRGSELDPELILVRKEKLCARVEQLVARLSESPSAGLSGEALARRLKEALAGNTIGGAGQAEERRRAEQEEVEAARAAWSRLSPLHGEAGEALEARFREACARMARERPAPAPEARAKPRTRPPGAGRASRTP